MMVHRWRVGVRSGFMISYASKWLRTELLLELLMRLLTRAIWPG